MKTNSFFVFNKVPGLFLLIFFVIGIKFLTHAQIVVNFIAPDTVCVGEMINITNQSTGGSTYYWSFCTGNTTYNPIGVNIGNPGGLLGIPNYSELVKDGNNCYSFICNQVPGHLVRYFHGSSFSNNPISWTNLGSFGMLGDTTLGIRIRYDNSQWIGFINDNNRIVRLNFGASVANTPTATLLGPYPMLNTAHGIEIQNENGTWIGLITCQWGNKLVRLNFGNSLLNIPVLTNLGTPGGLFDPAPFSLINENGNWWALILNFGDNTYSRITFGNSLLNVPTGVNLGQICGPIPLGGIVLIRDCEETTGFQLNYTPNTSTTNEIYRLNFPSGITGPITSTPIGNIGNMNKPCEFSGITRDGDSLYLYLTNRQDFTMTRLSFEPCTNASQTSSTLFNPPSFSYNSPGTYNVQLIVNEGLPDQANICKNIVVMNPPVVNLGADKWICPGNTTTLNAGTGFTSYLWSTGETTQSISTGSAGNYWVQVSKWGCNASDTVIVNNYPAPTMQLGSDTSICLGQTITFNAGPCMGCTYSWSNISTGQNNIGNGQFFTTGTQGVYSVSVTNTNGCSSVDTIQLFVTPAPVVTNFPLSLTTCSGIQLSIILTANVPGATFSWTASLTSGTVTGFSDDAGPVINQTLVNNGTIPGTVTYSITPSINLCPGQPSDYVVTVDPVPTIINLPNPDTICSGTSFSIALQSSVPGTTFGWTASGSSPDVTGFSNGAGTTISDVLFNSSFTLQSVTYSITPNSLGCEGSSQDWTVYVKPLPVTSFDHPDTSICSNTQTNIHLYSTDPSASFTWTVSGPATVSGFGSGSGSIIRQLLINSAFTDQTVTYHISSYANGCPGLDTMYPVHVHPVPDVYFTPQTQTICSGNTTNIQIQSHVSGANFTWNATGSSPYVIGFIPGIGPLIQQTLFNSNYIEESVIYTINPTANGCAGIQNQVIIYIDPVAGVTFVNCNDPSTITSAAPYRLKGGLPLGGTYSGSGVNPASGIFTPSAAGTGTKTLTYSYINTFSCSSSATLTITVFATPAFVCGNNVTDIRDNFSYPTVMIGSQCWMAQNLNYGTSVLSSTVQTDNCIWEKYCYSDSPLECNQYGGLYQWDELMQYTDSPGIQGLCPPGWHVPDENDWNILFSYYQNEAFAASPLLYNGFSGFNALVAGTRFINSQWDFEGFATFLWTSSSHGSVKAWAHAMNKIPDDHSVSTYPSSRSNALSVRCLKD